MHDVGHCFRAWQGKLKYGAPGLIRLCPQPAPMGVDDRPADRQPHSQAAGPGGVECLENALQVRRTDALVAVRDSGPGTIRDDYVWGQSYEPIDCPLKIER